MNVYCLAKFKDEFDKLKRKNSYKDLESQIVNYFFNTTVEKLSTGTRLNHDAYKPYIKTRISGKGGYRFYYPLILIKGDVYLMYVHPKKGVHGQSNIDNNLKKELYKEIIKCINKIMFIKSMLKMNY